MVREFMSKRETSAILVGALSGAIAVLVARGSGSLSLEREVSGVLSNPVPRRAGAAARGPGASLQGAAA